MNPVAIFRFADTEGPGYLGEFLDARQIPWRLIAIDAGDAVPPSAASYCGLVFMGGPMSVNDGLPWIAKVCALIREAVAHDIPVLGHCLGGQLIAKALGGVVSKNPVAEIGWGKVTIADNEAARSWFDGLDEFQAFHWHGETFSLPPGATLLLSSPHCANQGYAIGPHLALQCHVEMTEGMIASWCDVGREELEAKRSSPAVQSAEEMQQQMATELPMLHQVAAGLYTRWIDGLRVAREFTMTAS